MWGLTDGMNISAVVSGPWGHPIQQQSGHGWATPFSGIIGVLRQTNKKACPVRPLPPQGAVQTPQLTVEDVRTLKKVMETFGGMPLKEVKITSSPAKFSAFLEDVLIWERRRTYQTL